MALESGAIDAAVMVVPRLAILLVLLLSTARPNGGDVVLTEFSGDRTLIPPRSPV